MHGNKLYVELKLSYRNSNPFIISKPGAVRNRDNICFRIYFHPGINTHAIKSQC